MSPIVFQKIKGVTLLELLLVIVLLSIMSLVGINAMQRSVADDRIARTVLQFEEIAVASRSYYLSYGQTWPDSLASLSEFLPTNAWDLTAASNPFGENYNYTISQPTDAAGALLQITTTVPTAYSAENIIARLPLASVSGSEPYTVDMFVTIPSNISRYGHYIRLKEVQTINNVSTGFNQSVDLRNIICPFGSTLTWDIGMTGFYRTVYTTLTWWTTLTLISNMSDNTYNIAFKDTLSGGEGFVDVIIFKYCVPTNSL